jgi:DNA-binding response OmpR family regulator
MEGFDDYLVKPVAPPELFVAIMRVIRRPAPSAQPA